MNAPIRPIDPAQRPTLGTIVTDQLRDHVIHGHFEPGTILGEVDLAAQFGVSRGPIREALQRLVREGLLRREERRGISVPRMSDGDINDVYLAREAIEVAALTVIMELDTRSLATELRALVRQMDAAVDSDDWVAVADLDMAFHRRVVEAAGSPRLARLYGTVIGETLAFFNMTARYPGRERLVQEHTELADLVADRDLAGGREFLARHLSDSVDVLTRERRLASERRAGSSPPTAPVAGSRTRRRRRAEAVR
jgi:DNA-binding GntR family transcriptional regulator